jgi:LCP family protein required for cell wall assembly
MAPSGPAPARWVRVLVAVSASFALVVGVAGAVGAVRWVQFRNVGTDPNFAGAAPSGSPAPPPGRCSTEPCNYLLLGSDSRAGLPEDQQHQFGTNADIGGTNRADTIMLVHTDPALEKAIVLSFPRDLWVHIADGHGWDKINGAFEGGLGGGGPQLMADTVANLTGLSIDHYLYVDLNGFQHIVDTLGGVNLCIPSYDVNTPGWLNQHTASGGEQPIYYSEVGHVADPNTGLNVLPGCQQLDGYQALAYVRTRSLPCDSIPDFSRISRQQQFLRAVVNQMLRPAELARAPSLVGPILASMHRDSGFLPGDLVYLVGQLRGLSTGAVEFRAVPGSGGTRDGKSVVLMDASAEQIFAAIRDGKQLGDIGTSLLNTPPSEANTTVAVIDDGAGSRADEVETLLSNAGFDVSPGVVAGPPPAGVEGPAIVSAPGKDAYAQVVHAYFPDLPIVVSKHLTGAPVAVVVTSSYRPQPSGGPSASPSAAACPASP